MFSIILKRFAWVFGEVWVPGRVGVALISGLLLFCLFVSCQPTGISRQDSPDTRREAVTDNLHGVEIVDYYRWLEDQDSDETRSWIELQNEYSESILGDLAIRGYARQRFGKFLQVDDISMPFERGGFYFFSRKQVGQELYVLYRQEGAGGVEEVLLDPHGMSADHTTSVGFREVSVDGELLVYAVRLGGTDEVSLKVRDLSSGEDLPDEFPNALYGSVSLRSDKSGFYYAKRSRTAGGRIYYHLIGSSVGEDVEVFGQGLGPDKWVGADLSSDDRYLLLTVGHGWASTDAYLLDLASEGPPIPLVEGIPARFVFEFAGNQAVVMTNWQAPNNRILVIDLANPGQASWREIVPEGVDVIRGFSLIGGKIFVNRLHNVSTQISIYSMEGVSLGELPLPDHHSAYVSGRWQSAEAFVSMTSFVKPESTHRYESDSGEFAEWFSPDIPFAGNDYEVSQVWYNSKDGTRIPMHLVHRKGLVRTGDLPTLLYGYGGFNVSLTPRFRAMSALWIELGGVYAVANIRGGGEFGEEWHRAGMLENKQNVFDDFIAAAEWLVEKGYTNPRRLAIQGGSNGGLLVGAALTQRPDLYQAVLCTFPDLDMVRYYTFTENNNPPALLEYGNAADPEQFKFLYAYSPYQAVREGVEYPAVLLTTGDADTRVPPLQARKMAAVLQYSTSSDRPVLLLYDTQAGHAGGKPLAKAIEDLSMEAAFLLWQLGVDVPDQEAGAD